MQANSNIKQLFKLTTCFQICFVFIFHTISNQQQVGAQSAQHNGYNPMGPSQAAAAAASQQPKLCPRSTISLYHQHDNKLFFKIPENAPNGTCIGHVRSADNSVPDLLIALKKNSSDPHEINSVSDAELSYAFRLTSEGDLLTNAVLDRERREYYKFAAVCMRIFCEVVITIQIEDINDNAPKFYVPPELQQMPASKPEGLSMENISSIVIKWPEGQSRISYELPVAIDYDTGPNGIQEFVLRDANNTNRVQNIFCLVEHGAPSTTHCSDFSQESAGGGSGGGGARDSGSGVVEDIRQPFLQQDPVLVTSKQLAPAGSAAQPLFSYTKNSISLVNLKPLDRESQPRYQFIAQVVDGGQPPLIGRLLVTIEVTDINDNDPVFEKSHYEIRVKENITVGSSLLQVVAHDVDLEANGEISYYLHDSSGSSNNHQFRIDPKKGILSLAKQLDFEQDQVLELRVEARDHGPEPRSSYTVVKIYIEDVDQRPLAQLASSQSGNRSGQQQQLVANSDLINSDRGSPLNGGVKQVGGGGASASAAAAAASGNPLQISLSSTTNELMLGLVNSPHMLFVMILIALTAITLLTCLAKIRSRQPESDYEDTAQTKECPGANDVSPSGGGATGGDPSSVAALAAAAAFSRHNHSGHHHSSHHHGNHHHGSLNQYQVATLPMHNNQLGAEHSPSSTHHHWLGSARRGHMPSSTMGHHFQHLQAPESPRPPSASNHHHHHHHQVDRHQVATLPLPRSSSSNQHPHHHQSTHHLNQSAMAAVNVGVGGPHTPFNLPPMDFSHWTQTSTDSNLPQLVPGGGGVGGGHLGPGGPAGGGSGSALARGSGSNSPAATTTTGGLPSQLVFTQDLYGSYNWDYLADWTPKYKTLMPIVSTY